MKLKIAATLIVLPLIATAQLEGQWSIDRINAWYAGVGVIKGCNYLPATAVNDIDMWQESSFDPETIEKELQLAHESGYNSVRVFLHFLVWKKQRSAFKKNIETFLQIADHNDIKVMFILFDDCNAPGEKPFIGEQKAPRPGIHNSRWVASPGLDAVDDKTRFPEYESYLKDIISTYKNDRRIIAWDLYNEPGNTGVGTRSRELLLNAFKWAREINPTQPLTVGAWNLDNLEDEMSQLMMSYSDFVTFHSYKDVADLRHRIAACKKFNRPIVNTEWLRRQVGNTFENVLPVFAENRIGWYHWGLVQGKTQTWLHWVSSKDGIRDTPWQHDIFTPDHKAYSPKEIEMVKQFDFDAVQATYTNPLDVPVADPFVFHENGVYYLYGTDDPNDSSNGVPVLVSTDLVHWENKGYAFHKDETTWSQRNYWGPEVVKAGDDYYMYFNGSPNRFRGPPFNMHLCIARAKSPLGPFKEFKAPFYKPAPPEEAIDQNVFIDDDGTPYLVFTQVIVGRNDIRIVKLKKNMVEFDGEPVLAVYPTQEWECRPMGDGRHLVNEGGCLIKHKGWYYLTYTGNSFTDPDYAIGYATSRSPLGPWTKYDGNPILSKTDAVEGPGNGMFVKSPDGTELFIVYHTHYKPGQVGPRKVAIDRARFERNPKGEPDILVIDGPTSTPQPMPSAAQISMPK